MAKINGETYDSLAQLLFEVMERNGGIEGLKNYHESLKTDERVKDLGKRFRWDMFWGINFEDRTVWINGVYDELGANNSHIDTALRRWVAENVSEFSA